MDDETLELELATVFSGLDQARAYEEQLARIAAAQDQVRQGASGMASQVRALSEAQSRGSERTRRFATAATGGDVKKTPDPYSDPSAMSRPAPRRTAPAIPEEAPVSPLKAAWARVQEIAERATTRPRWATSNSGNSGPSAPRISEMFAPPSPSGWKPSRISTGGAGGLAAAGAAAGAAVLGIKMLADAAAEGAKRIKEYADAAARPSQEIAGIREVSGGSLGESAQLRALGVSGERAREFTERIASDPIAKAAAGRMGVQALPGPYGTLDTGKTLLQAIDRLRAIKNDDEALRAARAMNAEDLLRFRRVSDRTYNQMTRDGALAGRINDAPQVRRSAEYEAGLTRLQQAQENAKVAVSAPILEGLADLFNGIADVVNGFANLAKQNQGAIAGMAKFMEASGLASAAAIPGLGGPVAALSLARATGDANRKKDEQAVSSASPHVMALQANTEALVRLNINLGGGARSRAAIPAGIADGRNLSRAINTGHLALGPL